MKCFHLQSERELSMLEVYHAQWKGHMVLQSMPCLEQEEVGFKNPISDACNNVIYQIGNQAPGWLK